MKKRVFKSIAFLAVLFTIFYFAVDSSAKNQVSSQMPLPDAVCVYLSGVPVDGANVVVCNSGVSGSTTSGCLGMSLSSGTYQIVANYGTYGGETWGTFTSSPDGFVVNLKNGNIGCDNN